MIKRFPRHSLKGVVITDNVIFPVPLLLTHRRRCCYALVTTRTIKRGFSAQTTTNSTGRDHERPRKFLIHWKGEGGDGYSLQFRHEEFRGALAAVLGTSPSSNKHSPSRSISFRDALEYKVKERMDERTSLFNQAIQYIDISDTVEMPHWAFAKAAERCSLLRALYEIVAMSPVDTYQQLGLVAMQNGAFADLRRGSENGHYTWCIRVRNFNVREGSTNDQRHGNRALSVTKEKEALLELSPLLETFGGRVDLQNPNCTICIFDGLRGGMRILARRLAVGADIFPLSPNQRSCVTTTPLCPIAAFSLCNVAGIRTNSRILDPFAGSCSTLLAAAMLEPSCQSVAIDIAHNGLVNRDSIRKDFLTRHLTEPLALLHGDYRDDHVREKARMSVPGSQFDYIITDPPYGIRESRKSTIPIDDLLMCLRTDRISGKPLLRQGGKIVCFLPCELGQNVVHDVLPTETLLKEAGLRFELCCEQRLRSTLSRWLVSFVCVE